MNQKEFGDLIKKIRKENNLTQKDLADKYHVTYQAVSKWENGINMPDIMLIKQISNDYNISMDDVFLNKKNNKKIIYFIIPMIIIIISIFLIFILNKDNSFKFKTIKSNCDNFNITGSMSYDKNKSVIFISNVSYCGGKDDNIYDYIECSLFEKNNDIKKEIGKLDKKENIKLEEYLKNVIFSVDNHNSACKDYGDGNLFLEIYASRDGKVILYEIPLTLTEVCSN